MNPFKILYVSRLCSEKLLNFIYRSSTIKPIQSAQKFHRLLVEGFATQPDTCRVETLSLVPVVSATHKKKIWNIPKEIIGNTYYNYIPVINLPLLREPLVFLYTFFKVIFWGLFKKKENKVAICDTLILSISGASLLACKLTGIEVVGIVTDLPNLMLASTELNDNLKFRVYKKLASLIMTRFDKYILLTEQMNDVVNPLHKPYIVIEGLVDIKMNKPDDLVSNKAERILLYAGGIYEEYGIKQLIEAFMKLQGDNLSLHIFGPGEMEKDMPYYMKCDKRIVYKGIVPNQNVVECQLKATLLINPRPTNKELTKFSFPSKNMEYMVSGTPMVTTKLPGIPLEYYDYIYLFEDESAQGMAHTLEKLLLKSEKELINFGKKAQQFVLENKSNIIQAKKILQFLKNEEFKYV